MSTALVEGLEIIVVVTVMAAIVAPVWWWVLPDRIHTPSNGEAL